MSRFCLRTLSVVLWFIFRSVWGKSLPAHPHRGGGSQWGQLREKWVPGVLNMSLPAEEQSRSVLERCPPRQDWYSRVQYLLISFRADQGQPLQTCLLCVQWATTQGTRAGWFSSLQISCVVPLNWPGHVFNSLYWNSNVWRQRHHWLLMRLEVLSSGCPFRSPE